MRIISIFFIVLCQFACDHQECPPSLTDIPEPVSLEYYSKIEDNDLDSIDDSMEDFLAMYFRPFFIFDSAEQNTEYNEPVVLYQVHPLNCRMNCDKPLEKVEIIYAYLFKYDGGYNGGSSFCNGLDYHIGDNQSVLMELEIKNKEVLLTSVYNGEFIWPDSNDMKFAFGSHPVVYLSAGKHHAFNDTKLNHKASPYSNWGCEDDVDGEGECKMADISKSFAPRGRHNVGERLMHPQDYFVNDLEVFGFSGENAWDKKSFCGGVAKECDNTGPMDDIWK